MRQGIHEYLDYHGPIIMDSGGFLFQKRGTISIQAEEIHHLYRQAGVNIGVALDHPLDPSLSTADNARRWVETLRNTTSMVSAINGYAFMPVVHGYTLKALKAACRQIRNLIGNPVMIGIGSLVPLMKASHLGPGFRYIRPDGCTGDHVTFIADALGLVRDEFPRSLLHVFGIGGVTTILAVFSLGADSVDSVAWRLKAAYGAIQIPGTSDRFLSPRPNSSKSRKVLHEREEDLLAKCCCPVCRNYRTLGWQKRHLDSSFEARALHNAWVFLEEVKIFRKAIEVGDVQKVIFRRMSRTHRLFRLFRGYQVH